MQFCGRLAVIRRNAHVETNPDRFLAVCDCLSRVVFARRIVTARECSGWSTLALLRRRLNRPHPCGRRRRHLPGLVQRYVPSPGQKDWPGATGNARRERAGEIFFHGDPLITPDVVVIGGDAPQVAAYMPLIDLRADSGGRTRPVEASRRLFKVSGGGPLL